MMGNYFEFVLFFEVDSGRLAFFEALSGRGKCVSLAFQCPARKDAIFFEKQSRTVPESSNVLLIL